MTDENYFKVMQMLTPSRGQMPTELKRFITDVLKLHPNIELKAASSNEIEAVLNYLNHTCPEPDLLNGKPGFARYKDALLCISPDKSHWMQYGRDADAQLWDLWEYLQTHVEDDEFEKSLSTIYVVK